MAKKKESGWSDLYTKEDWIAVWLGFLIIALILLSTSQFKFDTKSISPSFKWTTDGQIASRIDGWNKAADSIIKEAQAKDDAGTVKRLGDLKEALAKGDRKGIGAATEKVARLGDLPGALGKEIAGRAKSIPEKVFSGENTGKAVKLGIAYLILAAIGMILLKGQVGKFIIGFPIIFFLAWVSNFIAGNALALDWGVEYVVYALVLGILISNTVGVPEWLKPAVQTEYYIKTGLVILGSGILFFEILQGGALGIIQALLVVSVVWYIWFWLGRELKSN